jgi:hypothetical protein
MPWDKVIQAGKDLLVEYNGVLSGDKGCDGTYTCTGRCLQNHFHRIYEKL